MLKRGLLQLSALEEAQRDENTYSHISIQTLLIDVRSVEVLNTFRSYGIKNSPHTENHRIDQLGKAYSYVLKLGNL